MGERARVAVYAPEPGNGVGDPVEVARDVDRHAQARQHDIVIIDTAGRLGIDQEMMRQAADIRDAVRPDEILFVVDAMIGQDAVTTAQAFLDGVGFDGVVLTKLDGDARGGAALSVRHITGRPIMFASTGEKLEDFDAFHPDRMASRILDMGDMLTLIEQAEKTFDEEEAAQDGRQAGLGRGLHPGGLPRADEMVRKMGPIGKLLGMMPGMGQMREQIENIDERDLDRIAAIIRSMTPASAGTPRSSTAPAAPGSPSGSGVEVSDVNSLVTRFFEAQKMIRSSSRAAPGMPGCRLPRHARHGARPGKAAKAQKKGKKGQQRSGDPLKARAGRRPSAPHSRDGSGPRCALPPPCRRGWAPECPVASRVRGRASGPVRSEPPKQKK